MTIVGFSFSDLGLFDFTVIVSVGMIVYCCIQNSVFNDNDTCRAVDFNEQIFIKITRLSIHDEAKVRMYVYICVFWE